MAPAVRLRFGHGLGDNVYFAHLLSWYGRLGYNFQIDIDRDKAPLYRPLRNVHICQNLAGAPSVSWKHGDEIGRKPEQITVFSNKIVTNLSLAPLPEEGVPTWRHFNELRQIQLDAAREISAQERSSIYRVADSFPKPLILFHPKGNTLQQRKNLTDEEINEVCLGLVEQSPGTLMILDWDRRIDAPRHPRIHLVERAFGKRLGLVELISLLNQANLIIGVDSGPVHLARMIPGLAVLFLWEKHHPFAFCLPKEGHIHLLPEKMNHPSLNAASLGFDIKICGSERLPADSILQHALNMLGTSEPCGLTTNASGMDRVTSAFMKRAPEVSSSGGIMTHGVSSGYLNDSEFAGFTSGVKDAIRKSDSTLALYSYSSDNIGDDMQSLVLRRWLGYSEDEICFFDRDFHQFNRTAKSQRVTLLINGFIGKGALPIPEFEELCVDPIFLAIHMASVHDDNPAKMEQLRRFSPIGCRDLQSLRECKENDIPAYFGGCPTILCERADVKQDIDILLIDVNPRNLPKIPENRVVHYSSNMKIPGDTPLGMRADMCLRRWELLSRARLVVTSKLHAAMPAIGMGVPVVFIKENIVCSGRLTAFPDGFPLLSVNSRFSWDPDAHRFDVSKHRNLVEKKLIERIGRFRKRR